MARRVLGNDPFKTGAAQRPPATAAAQAPAQPPPPPKEATAAEPKSVKPASPNRVVKAAVTAAPARALSTQRPTPEIVAHDQSPTAVALSGREPLRHAGSPTVGADPIPHAHSPVASHLPTAHPDSPSAGHLPTPHAGSPSVQVNPVAHAGSPQLPADPLPHAASPRLGVELTPPSGPVRGAPVAHAGSPRLPADPRPHAASPRPAVEMTPPAFPVRAPPVGHSGSPRVSVDPRPHAGSPFIKPLPVPHEDSPVIKPLPVPHEDSPVIKPLPVPHQDSPQLGADPIPHADSPGGREVLPPVDAGADPTLEVEAIDPGASARGPAPSFGHTRAARDQTLALAKTLFESGVSLPLWGAARGLFQAARSGLGLGALGDLDAWGKDVALTAQLEPLASFLFDRYWRVEVQGAELLPRGPSLIVANHSGALPLDGPMLRYALERSRADLPQARWLVEDQLFHTPFFGLLSARLGAVRANPENALRLLAEGQSVIVFPEGIHGLARPFGERYQLRRFGRGGFVKIALRAKVPIVPAALVGADESMPLLGTLPGGPFGLPHLPLTTPPLPARWFLRFGKPIDLKRAPRTAEEDLAFVQRENERTRDVIAGMLTTLLQQRDSIF